MIRYKVGDTVTSKSFNQMLNSIPLDCKATRISSGVYSVRGINGRHYGTITTDKCDVTGKIVNKTAIGSARFPYAVKSMLFQDWMIL